MKSFVAYSLFSARRMAIKALGVGVALVVFVPVTSCTAALVGVRPPWVTSRTICRTGMMIERKGRCRMRE